MIERQERQTPPIRNGEVQSAMLHHSNTNDSISKEASLIGATVPQKSVHMFPTFLYLANYSVNTTSKSMKLQSLDSQTSVLYKYRFLCLYTFRIWKYARRKQGMHVNSFFATSQSGHFSPLAPQLIHISLYN